SGSRFDPIEMASSWRQGCAAAAYKSAGSAPAFTHLPKRIVLSCRPEGHSKTLTAPPLSSSTRRWPSTVNHHPTPSSLGNRPTGVSSLVMKFQRLKDGLPSSRMPREDG